MVMSKITVMHVIATMACIKVWPVNSVCLKTDCGDLRTPEVHKVNDRWPSPFRRCTCYGDKTHVKSCHQTVTRTSNLSSEGENKVMLNTTEAANFYCPAPSHQIGAPYTNVSYMTYTNIHSLCCYETKPDRQKFTGSCNIGYTVQAGKKEAFKYTCMHCGGGCCHKMENARYPRTGAPVDSEFPWSAALFVKNGSDYQFFCGGVLIKPDMVLTSTDCLLKLGRYYRPFGMAFLRQGWDAKIDLKRGQLKVSIGEQNILINQRNMRIGDFKSLINVRSIRTTPQPRHYKDRFHEFDVALLTLEKETRNPVVCLDGNYEAKKEHLSNYVCYGLGYGPTPEITSNHCPDFGSLGVLKKIPVQLLDVGSCNATLQNYSKKYFCARRRNGASKACHIFVGSPVVCRSNPDYGCSPYFVGGIFPDSKSNGKCDETKSIVINMLNANGNLTSANLTMNMAGFIFENTTLHEDLCIAPEKPIGWGRRLMG